MRSGSPANDGSEWPSAQRPHSDETLGSQGRYGSGARSEPQDVLGSGRREAPFGPEISWPYGFRKLDPESREVLESAYGTSPAYQQPAMDDFGYGDAGPYGDAATLPLLSHALLATWQRAHRGRLTVADYVDHGATNTSVTVSGHDANLLVGSAAGYDIPLLVVESGQRTIAVSVLGTLVPAAERSTKLGKLAALVVGRTGG